jgi:hypothetical protein
VLSETRKVLPLETLLAPSIHALLLQKIPKAVAAPGGLPGREDLIALSTAAAHVVIACG